MRKYMFCHVVTTSKFNQPISPLFIEAHTHIHTHTHTHTYIYIYIYIHTHTHTHTHTHIFIYRSDAKVLLLIRPLHIWLNSAYYQQEKTTTTTAAKKKKKKEIIEKDHAESYPSLDLFLGLFKGISSFVDYLMPKSSFNP